MTELEKKIRKACEPYMGMPIAMSGGIDSSLLAAIIKPKYVISVEVPGKNESELVRKIARHLKLDVNIIRLSDYDFKDHIEKAVRIVGEPCKHFNVFPLYIMFKVLKDLFHEKDIVIGDGPDESMHGYARDLIFEHLMSVYYYKAFQPYTALIDKVLNPWEIYAKLSNLPLEELQDMLYDDQFVNKVNMKIKRPEMDMMAASFGKHFGIKIHKPYEIKEVDEYMFNLPLKDKIHKVEYGKYALRKIAAKYLPKEVAWKKVKVGGPVFPVNEIMGWNCGKYDKRIWLEFQKDILK